MSDERALLSLPPLARFAETVRSALGEAREELDALNVYPVPDGDTGTNLFLTFDAAHRAMQLSLEDQGGLRGASLSVTVAAYARGLLLGARGNSGVIMSQLVGALVRRLAEAPEGERVAVSLAEGMAMATAASYAAVGEPAEGTILTVAAAASEAAGRVARDPEARARHVMAAAAQAAREALERTPDQLPVLKRAGVVDAGGQGLCVVLDAAETALTGKRPARPRTTLGHPAIPVLMGPLAGDDLTEGGPSYEVMYLLDTESAQPAEATGHAGIAGRDEDAAIRDLREALRGLGDSLVVVGGEGLWNVHVHVDDVGAAIEAGIAAGRPHRIRVTHFADQAGSGSRSRQREGRRVVVLAHGPGLARLFGEAGAEVLAADPAARPSTGELLEAIRRVGAHEVVLLPNDRDAVPAAEAAARTAQEDDGIRVAVVPTPTQVQGLAALAVHEPGRSFEADLTEMTAAARHARTGAVTVAARRAMTSAGPCEPGDALGAVEGDFVVVGKDLFAVAGEVIERMLGGGGELFTIVHGKDSGDLPQRCSAHLAARHPTVEVAVYDGGQERYPLLFGVE